jgi:hypothetical protein
MRSAKPTDARRLPASARTARRGRRALVKPALPAYAPHDEFDRDDVEQLLLQAARLRANRALSE